MSAPLSVVIPVLDAADRLGPCLGSLGEALFEGLIGEVILADGGSGDDIAGVAEATGARLIVAPRGRGAQLAAGAASAGRPWLLFLHADSVLAPDWSEAAARHMRQWPDRAGYFDLRFRSTHPMARVVAGWANGRARLLALPYGDQGLLISKTLYDRVGGYEQIPLMEDVAMARALGRRLRRLGTWIETSPERYERHGWVRHGGRNLWRLARYMMGADPSRLATAYARGR